MNKNGSIEKKLTVSIFKVSTITAAIAAIALIALIITSNRYSYALKNFGFAQGDIGRTMFEFADLRSSLRAAIGYDNADAIAAVVQQHEELKVDFEESFKKIEETIVSEDGRKTYNQIKSELDNYWKLDTQIMELGATTDRELCKQAQDIALTELADVYNSIYEQLESLLDVKVTEGNSLSTILTVVGWVLAALILIVIGAAMVLSTKLGKKIAQRISVPLGNLGMRLNTFSTGDLSSPFPTIDTGDEVEEIGKDISEMAKNLDIIISDIGEVLSEMAHGNYTVRSKAREKYTGDFQKLYESMRGLRNQMKETLLSIGEASSQVSAGSNELANASQCLAEGATEQAGAVEKLHEAISTITETMEKSAQNADDSYIKAQQYANQADNSREEMNTMMVAMQRINETSTRIGDIISEIESIASQTNLLSLNASIEAARAGDAGRGFAVVASQIQKLAEQSNVSAQQIDQIIFTLLEDSQKAVHTMKEVKEIITQQSENVSKTGAVFSEVKNGISDSIQGVGEIASHTNRLNSARSNIVDVVQNLTSIAEQNAASTEETSAAVMEVADVMQEISNHASKLQQIASTLETNVDIFQL